MITPWQRLNQLSQQTGISHGLLWGKGYRPTNQQINRAISMIEYELQERQHAQSLFQIQDIQLPRQRRDFKAMARGRPDIELIRNYSIYKGAVERFTYRWTNPLAMNKKTFLQITNRFATHATIRFPVLLDNGMTMSYKTVKAKNLPRLASNNFTFNTRSIGSDEDYAQDGALDFSRPFIVMETKQKSQLKGKCNNQKETIKQLNNCVVIDPYTRNKNCGFQCLKKLGFKTDIPLKNQGGLTPKQLLDICERNQIPIEVLLDEIDENNNLKSLGKTSTGMVPHRKIVFAMKNDVPHYYVFHSRSESKEEKKQKNKEVLKQQKEYEKKLWVLVFYDLETIFDNDDDQLAKTYGGAYLPILESQFNEEITKENIKFFQNKCRFLEGENVCEQMVSQLCQLYDTEKYRFKFISFNGSNFDDYFLLKQAMTQGENVTATYQTKSILGLKFQYGQCWDLRKFLTVGSLHSLCYQFQVFPKKIEGFSHKTVQYQYEDEETLLGWDIWKQMNIQEIEEYNKYDVLSLYSLTQKFRNLIKDLTQTDVFEHLTIGSHSYDLCKSKWSKEMEELLKAPVEEKDDLFIRKCLTAGRCQVMGKENGEKYIHLKGRRLSMVDIVSLYPYQMINKDCLYPCGAYSYVQQRNKEKLGFYQISVKQRSDLPNVLPKRDFEHPEIPLDWDNKTEYETYCCSIDLDVLEQYGSQYKIIMGLEFEQKLSGDVIFQSLIPFQQEKIKQDVYKEIYAPAGAYLYNQAMRETCKIYLNSLSGKVIQRNFDNVTKIIRCTRELHKFLDECQDGSTSIHYASPEFVIGNGKKQEEKRYTQKRAKPSYLGVYIYSHARKHMYTNIYSLTQTRYTDTDSALMTHEDELKLRQLRPELFQKIEATIDGMKYEIKPFGSLDCELKENANEAILMRPKCYFVGNREEKYVAKLKCKGVSFKGDSCKYVPDSYVHKTITKQGFDYIEETLQSNPFKLFDQLMYKGKVRVACEQLIVKSLRSNNTTFGIAIRHIIKEIKLDDSEADYDALMDLSE